jgi:hypothetical protein
MNLAVKFNLLKDTQIHNHIIFINQKVVWKMTITNYILIVQFYLTFIFSITDQTLLF